MLKRKVLDVALTGLLLLPGLAFAGEPYAIAKDLAIRSSQDAAVEERQDQKTESIGKTETNVESGTQWIEDQVNSALTDDAPESTGGK